MKCKKHPGYKGIRKPRVDCLECWKIYARSEIDRLQGENTGLRNMVESYQSSSTRWEEICLTLEKKLVEAEARVKELEEICRKALPLLERVYIYTPIIPKLRQIVKALDNP